MPPPNNWIRFGKRFLYRNIPLVSSLYCSSEMARSIKPKYDSLQQDEWEINREFNDDDQDIVTLAEGIREYQNLRCSERAAERLLALECEVELVAERRNERQELISSLCCSIQEMTTELQNYEGVAHPRRILNFVRQTIWGR